MSTDKAVIFLRLHPKVKAAVEKKAQAKHMSVNLFLEELLVQQLDVKLEEQLRIMTRAAGRVA